MSGKAVVGGVRATTLDAVRAGAIRAGCGEHWVACDATLGVWRARHLALELALQLGVDLAEGTDVRAVLASREDAPPLSEMIGAGIDAEANGNRTVRLALSDARAIARSAADRCSGIVVLAPRAGHLWSAGDEQFLGFLAEACDGDHLVVVVTDDGPAPKGRGFQVEALDEKEPGTPPAAASPALGALVPGVVDPSIAERLATARGAASVGGLELRGGHRLVAPELRPRSPVARARFDQLGAVLARTWIEPYAEFHGNNLFVDLDLFARHAWQAFSAGAVDLALRLMRRAIECASTPTRRAVLEAQAQGMRIAALRFDDAASAPNPPPGASTLLRAFLLEAKGWGLVMSGRATDAVGLLGEARGLMVEAGARGVEYLYLLNITALGELRRGEVATALVLEEEIRAKAEELDEEDARLTYVNSINLARLHRRSGDLDRARECYERAFTTSLGARSEGDQVYVNAMLAMLAQAAGRFGDADRAWFRTALHWLACDAPEAIGDRVVAGIAGSSLAEDDPVDALSSAILGKWSECGQLVDLSATEALRFTKAGPDMRCPRVVSGNGWTLGLAEGEGPPSKPRKQSAYERLRAVVSKRVRAAAPSAFGQTDTAVVDDRFGQHIAISFGDVVEMCVRLQTTELWLGENLITLDGGTRRALEARSRLILGPAVAVAEQTGAGVRIGFRRYLDPILVVAASSLRVVEAATEGARVDELTPSIDAPGMRAVLDELRAARVIDVQLTEEACMEVGIRLRSNETSASG